MEIECSICLEELCDFVIETPCKHLFCLKCLKDWQTKEILDNLPLTCPNCRKNIPKIQDELNIKVDHGVAHEGNNRNQGYINLSSNSIEVINDEETSVCCCCSFFVYG